MFFPGKKRLWVITASSHNDHYLQMMEKQLEDVEQAKCFYYSKKNLNIFIYFLV